MLREPNIMPKIPRIIIYLDCVDQYTICIGLIPSLLHTRFGIWGTRLLLICRWQRLPSVGGVKIPASTFAMEYHLNRVNGFACLADFGLHLPVCAAGGSKYILYLSSASSLLTGAGVFPPFCIALPAREHLALPAMRWKRLWRSSSSKINWKQEER